MAPSKRIRRVLSRQLFSLFLGQIGKAVDEVEELAPELSKLFGQVYGSALWLLRRV
jgi:hypothetical protein